MKTCISIRVGLLTSLALASLAAPPQSLSQLSTFSRAYPTRSRESSGYQEQSFAQTNAVPWTKPADVTGITSIQTNRATVSITLRANNATGILSGGIVDFDDGVSSQNLTFATIPTVSTAGLITIPAASAGFTATGGANWRYNASMKQVDKPNTATGIGTLGGGEFSSQEGGSSAFNGASITMTGGNITANPGTGVGTTVTMQVYSETANDTTNGTVEYSNAGDAQSSFTGYQLKNQAQSSNLQTTFDATTASGNGARSYNYGVEEAGAGGAVTSGGFGNAGFAGVGTAGDSLSVIAIAPGGTGTNVLSDRPGEDAVTLAIGTGPGYADQATTVGGNDAAAISYTNTNNIATGAAGSLGTTQKTTCIATAYECGGGVAVGSTAATFIKVLSNGSFSAFY